MYRGGAASEGYYDSEDDSGTDEYVEEVIEVSYSSDDEVVEDGSSDDDIVVDAHAESSEESEYTDESYVSDYADEDDSKIRTNIVLFKQSYRYFLSSIGVPESNELEHEEEFVDFLLRSGEGGGLCQHINAPCQLLIEWLLIYSAESRSSTQLDLFFVFFSFLFCSLAQRPNPGSQAVHRHSRGSFLHSGEGADSVASPIASPAVVRRVSEGESEAHQSQERLIAAEIENLKRLIETNAAVQGYCIAKKWGLRALFVVRSVPSQVVADALVGLVKTLLYIRTSIVELKELLRSVANSADFPRGTGFARKLLDLLPKLEHEGPQSVFDFSGTADSSGMILPEAPKWPNGGWSVCFWLKVNTFEDINSRALGFYPMIFSATGGKASGVQIYLNRAGNLVVWMGTGRKATSTELKYKFPTGRWVFIAITHAYKYIGKCPVTLFVDNKKRSVGAIPYPKFSEDFDNCCIGSKPRDVPSPTGSGADSKYETFEFNGQLGSILFFNCRLSSEEVSKLYLNKTENNHLSSFRKNQTLLAKIFLAYSPQEAVASEGANLFVEYNPSAGEQRMAVGLSETHAITFSNMTDHLSAIGGVTAVVMLISKACGVRQPFGAGSDEEAERLLRKQGIESFVGIIEYLSVLLCEARNQQQMLKDGGFELMGLILSQILPSRFYWDEPLHRLLNSLQELEENLKFNVELLDQFWKHVYFNFHIWRHSPAATQSVLLDMLRQTVQKHTKYLRTKIGVRGILDIIRMHYWTSSAEHGSSEDSQDADEEESVAEAEETPLGYSTDDDASRGGDSQVSELAGVRRKFLMLVIDVLRERGKGLQSEEAQCIYRFILESSKAPAHLADVLHILPMWCDRIKGLSQLLTELGSGVDSFLFLLGQVELNDHNRCELIMALRSFVLFQTGGSFLNYQVTVVKYHLQTRPLTRGLYFALLALLLNTATPYHTDPLAAKHHAVDTKGLAIVHEGVVPVIFELACGSADDKLHEKILRDFLFLLQQSDANCDKFLSSVRVHACLSPRQPAGGQAQGTSWKSWLFGLVSRKAKGSHAFLPVRDMFLSLLLYQMRTGLWEHDLDETEVLANYFSEQGTLDGELFLTTLHRKLGSAIVRTVKTMRVSDGATGRDSIRLLSNIVHWIQRMERLMFYSPLSTDSPAESHDPFTLYVHRGAEDEWTHLLLAQFVIEILDVLPVQLGALASLMSIGEGPMENLDLARLQQGARILLPRVGMRLQLQMLFEAESTVPGSLAGQRAACTHLVDFTKAAVAVFPATDVNDSLMQALSRYTARVEERLGENAHICEQMYRHAGSRLCQIVRAEESPVTSSVEGLLHLLFLIAFLYRVFSSTKDGGSDSVGTGLVWQLIGALAKSLKRMAAKLDSSPIPADKSKALYTNVVSGVHAALRGVKDEMLADCFTRGFSNPSAFNLAPQLNEALRRIHEDTKQRLRSNQALLQTLRTSLLSGLEEYSMQQREMFAEADEKSRFAYEAEIGGEQERCALLNNRMQRSREATQERFEGLFGQFNHERGPLYNPERPPQLALELSPWESSTRMRAALQARHRQPLDGWIVSAGAPGSPSYVAGGPTWMHPSTWRSYPSLDPRPSHLMGRTLLWAHASCRIRPLRALPLLLGYLSSSSAAGRPNVRSGTSPSGQSPRGKSKRGKSPRSGVKHPPGLRDMGSSLVLIAHTGAVLEEVPISSVASVRLRRYLSRNCALEIEVHGALHGRPCRERRKHLFLVCSGEKERDSLISDLTSVLPPGRVVHPKRVLEEAAELSSLWQQHLLSNFEYLMALNTIAGRTYEDISQYPVFPWVLADYRSPALDLSNPLSFRDLSKPVGMLSGVSRGMFRPGTSSATSPWPTGYSSIRSTLYYLMRLQPFSDAHAAFFGADFAGRMTEGSSDKVAFSSIQGAWEVGLLSDPPDVKELTPEFFYMADFLRSPACRGDTANARMGDVQLPPWARTPEEFVSIHRQALESSLVRAALPRWIDLVFGFAQTGPTATEACNWYPSFAYADDLSESDEADTSVLRYGGLCPAPLFPEPHATAKDPPAKSRGTVASLSSSVVVTELKPRKAGIGSRIGSRWGASGSAGIPSMLYFQIVHSVAPTYIDFLYEDSVVTCNVFHPNGKSGKVESDKRLKSSSPPSFTHAPPRPGVAVPYFQFFPHPVAPDVHYAVYGGQYGGQLVVSRLPETSQQRAYDAHAGMVTCLASDSEACIIAAGSEDTTVSLWTISHSTNPPPKTPEKPKGISSYILGTAPPVSTEAVLPVLQRVATLRGHDAPVTSLALSTSLGVCVSASMDGTCIVSNLAEGLFVRSIRSTADDIQLVRIEEESGTIVTYETKGASHALGSYSIHTGRRLAHEALMAKAADILIAPSGKVVFTAEPGRIGAYALPLLRPVGALPVKSPAVCLSLLPTSQSTLLLAGLRSGSLLAVSLGS